MPEGFDLAGVVVVDTHGIVDLVLATNDPEIVLVHPVIVCLN